SHRVGARRAAARSGISHRPARRVAPSPPAHPLIHFHDVLDRTILLDRTRPCGVNGAHQPAARRRRQREGGGMKRAMALGVGAGLLAIGSAASASTLTTNLSWTIDRAGTSTKYRVAAYGDSIYAGWHGSISNVAKRAAPLVSGEYASNVWNSDVEVIRRCK